MTNQGSAPLKQQLRSLAGQAYYTIINALVTLGNIALTGITLFLFLAIIGGAYVCE